ncbi:MAG: LamG domain-containing protein [Planctomycetes bacterium]|nr:LamG domain-containing protein [Planctomycetota bacterium]
MACRLPTFVAAVFLTASIPMGLAQADIISGLENHYSFDDQGNPENDDSGNGRHATISGAVWVDDPERGGVLEFVASQADVVTAPVPTLSGNGVTIALWAKRVGGHAGGNEGLFVARGGAVNSKTIGAWVAGNDRIWGRIRSGGNRSLPQNGNAVMPGDGIWTHLTYRGEGAQYQLCQDGVFTGNSISYSNPPTLDDVTNIITIGRQGTESWTGQLDDVRVYSRALSDQDIADLASGVVIPEPGSAVLLILGALGIALLTRRRQARP